MGEAECCNCHGWFPPAEMDERDKRYCRECFRAGLQRVLEAIEEMD